MPSGQQHRVLRKGISSSRSSSLHDHIDRVEIEDDEGRKKFLGIPEIENLIQTGDSFFIVDIGSNTQHQIYPVKCKDCHRGEKVLGSMSQDDDWEEVMKEIEIRPY
jgi:uncharacterized protein Veg